MKISIITATFNSGRTVADTFESVLGQDYGDYELIVKDGGSKDDTLEICRRYEPRFEGRMRIIAEPDRGIYDAMNQGIAAATGDVIGILNSDDFYTAPDILSTVAAEFERHGDIDAVYGDVHYVDEHDMSKHVRYYSSRRFKRWMMRLGFMPAHPSFYCRRSTYEKFRLDGRRIEGFKGNPDCAFFNTTYRIAADFECLLRLIYVNRIVTRYIHRDFVTMRTGGASSSGVASHRQINRDHMRAFRENGVYSNYFLISLRYCYKVLELIKGRFCRMMQ
ncbi:MAG: glycosyltransferase family 2 protein [Muribaculaceae bacterium]